MIKILKDRFENLEIINNDILKVDLNSIINENLKNLSCKHTKIVANFILQLQ